MTVVEGIWQNRMLEEGNVLDPELLALFKDTLGRKQAKPDKDYMAYDLLLSTILNSFVLKAGQKVAGIYRSLENFGGWISENDRSKDIIEVVDTFFRLVEVQGIQNGALELAEDAYTVRFTQLKKDKLTRRQHSAAENTLQTQTSCQRWIEKHSLGEQDVVHENGLKTMPQCMTSRLNEQNIGHERSGTWEKDVEILMLFFAGSNKPKYIREMLHYSIDRQLY